MALAIVVGQQLGRVGHRRARGGDDAVRLHALLGEQPRLRRPPRRARTSRAASARPPRRSGRSSASPRSAARCPVVSSRAATRRMPSASTVNVTSSRAIPAGMGGIPFSVNRASERQSAASSRSPCTTCRSKPVCLSANVVNVCCRAARHRRVAVNQLLDDAAHRLEPERQRHDVQQQHVAVGRAAREHVGLHRGAQRDHLVGIDVGQRRPPEQLRRRSGAPAACASRRRPGSRPTAAPGSTPASASARRTGAAQRASTGATSASISVAREPPRVRRAVVRRDVDRGIGPRRQRFLDGARRVQHCDVRGQVARIRASASRARVGALRDAAALGDRAIEVVAAQRRVAAGRLHLEHAVLELAGSRCRTCRRPGRTPRTSPRPACRGRRRAPPRSAR